MAKIFNENQLLSLKALCDAAFQGHEGPEAAEILAAVPADAPSWQKERVEKFVKTKFSDLPGALDALEDQFAKALSPDNIYNLTLTLSMLATRAGTLALTGHVVAFPDLTVQQREQVLLSWKSSRLTLLRQAFRGFVCICLFIAYHAVDDNALAVGYPANGDPARGLDTMRIRKHYPFKFETIASPFQHFETDVLIVGSGAGGGVVSSELSKKGYHVTVIDKGRYLRPEEMTGKPKDGFNLLYENDGLIATEDGSINVLAGGTFGGGTTVNWSASLRPQHYLREDWAKKHNLPHFLSQDFTDSIDYVCKRMKVSPDHLKHSKPNNRLIDGSLKLGYDVTKMPQNTGGNEHSCGFCSFGCPYSEKQSGPVAWLRDAAENGANFFVETKVEKLLFASSANPAVLPTATTLAKFTPDRSRRHCIGAVVRCNHSGNLAFIRARQAVVVSSGSINSPAVLMKSGLKNPRIGKNLRLHPTSYITGFYDENINPWEGSIMTAVSNVRENRDGSHHGVKLEVNMSFPGGSAASFMKWVSSKDHKKNMVKFNHAFTLIAIARDRGSGQIVVDKNGIARMDYVLDSYDGDSILRGIIAGAEIHLAAGANRIQTTQVGVDDYIPAPGHKFLSDPKWLEWIAKVEKVGVHSNKVGLGSAHQMGSCQMGSKPTTSVVDPRARVWGTNALYVADAVSGVAKVLIATSAKDERPLTRTSLLQSIFPTASAVNPMITNMSLSHSVAQFIDEDLKAAKAAPLRAHL